MQSQRSLRRVSVKSKSLANFLQMRGDLISINAEKKKFICMIRKPVKLKKKSLFGRLIKLTTSDKDVSFSESFNLAAKKKHERCEKNQNRKEKWL